ncbi:[citrate (pro-3S)-lyase] ligase [Acetonema longum]|uniref:[Citrate [pro-3S]-lyase] ligase n=1 Tax=Acetonema longum DSM 6540 TaxID=1009370 RepID=F7NNZ0_9FIRM|nr:[citrate (pro-3S)-lyase] ligase [Acetonema longum]EGO62324.1 citrate lyase ligase [Acetonema longum DSM 6540]
MFGSCEIERVDLKNAGQVAAVRTFLARFGLSYDEDVEYTINLRLHGNLAGTGSFKGEILRNIAVDESVQGAGFTATIVSELMQEQARRGRMHYFIFTKPAKAHLFGNLGFVEICRAEPYAALLETGLGSVGAYCAEIAQKAAHIAHIQGPRAAVVVNCNPFTLGHLALIEKAAGENAAVIVFVVSEDRSLFPFDVRFRLVREGVAHLANVAVVPGGKYIISAATFPTYFTHEEDKVVAQTRLDINLFAGKIAPNLGIRARYIGREPYCPVTNAYNTAMLDILPAHGIEVRVLERTQIQGEIVSASKVRDRIRQDDWEVIRSLVPAVTYRYLRSEDAREILEKIRSSDSRH